MKTTKELLKEKEWLLKEYNYLEEISTLLNERERKLPALKDEAEIIAFNKSVKRKIKQLLRKIGRTERRVYNFEERLLKQIKKLGYDENKILEIDSKYSSSFNGKKISEIVRLYSRDIVKATSWYGGSLQKILAKKKFWGLSKKETAMNWKEFKLEVYRALINFAPLIALLDYLAHASPEMENRLQLLQSFGFDTNYNKEFTKFLLEHWDDVLELKKAAGAEHRYFFGNLLKSRLLQSRLSFLYGGRVPWEQAVNGLILMLNKTGGKLELLKHLNLYLEITQPLFNSKIITWAEVVKGDALCQLGKYLSTYLTSNFPVHFIENSPKSGTSIEDLLLQKVVTWAEITDKEVISKIAVNFHQFQNFFFEWNEMKELLKNKIVSFKQIVDAAMKLPEFDLRNHVGYMEAISVVEFPLLCRSISWEEAVEFVKTSEEEYTYSISTNYSSLTILGRFSRYFRAALRNKVITFKQLVTGLPAILEAGSINDYDYYTNPAVDGEMLFLGNLLEQKKFSWEDLPLLVRAAGGLKVQQFVSKGLINEENWPHIKAVAKIMPVAQLLRDLGELNSKKNWQHLEKIITQVKLNPQFIEYILIPLILSLKKAEDWENLEAVLAHPNLKIKSYEMLFAFCNALMLNPQQMKKPLRNLIASLITTSISAERADIESSVPRLRDIFGRLLRLSDLDLETKFLLRRLASLLPLGGDTQLIYTIRNEAIDLDIQLNGLRNKIHNWPGKEDIEIVAAYIHFLNTKDITSFESLCKQHGVTNLDYNELSLNHNELKTTTLTIAESLLSNLRKLWQIEAYGFEEKLKILQEEYARLELDKKQEKCFKDIMSKLKKLRRCLKNTKKDKAAHLLGDLRFDVRVLEEGFSGALSHSNLRIELYLLDLLLESLETQVHPEIMEGITLKKPQDLNNLIKLIIQKSLSVMATYSSDVALAEAVHRLDSFEKSANLSDLNEALEYFSYGIGYLNGEVVDQFKKIFQEKMLVSKKELEELVSPFYRTGPIFQLDQLVQVLRQGYESGTIAKILQKIPRPVATHLRERLYQRIGLQ